jgi:hypothetical protein
VGNGQGADVGKTRWFVSVGDRDLRVLLHDWAGISRPLKS